jgi:membrane protease subunit HflK
VPLVSPRTSAVDLNARAFNALDGGANVIIVAGFTANHRATGHDSVASRFKQVLTEYAKAPAVTRERLYLDTMQQVFANTTKVLVESRGNSNLLYLPLDRLTAQASAEAGRAPGTANGNNDVRPEASTPAPAPVSSGTRDGLRNRDRDAGR